MYLYTKLIKNITSQLVMLMNVLNFCSYQFANVSEGKVITTQQFTQLVIEILCLLFYKIYRTIIIRKKNSTETKKKTFLFFLFRRVLLQFTFLFLFHLNFSLFSLLFLYSFFSCLKSAEPKLVGEKK